MALVALHRGFDGLLLWGLKGWQGVGIDADPDRARCARCALDEALSLE